MKVFSTLKRDPEKYHTLNRQTTYSLLAALINGKKDRSFLYSGAVS